MMTPLTPLHLFRKNLDTAPSLRTSQNIHNPPTSPSILASPITYCLSLFIVCAHSITLDLTFHSYRWCHFSWSQTPHLVILSLFWPLLVTLYMLLSFIYGRAYSVVTVHFSAYG